MKKTPSKVSQKNSNPLFFLTASSAQTAQTEEFMFQNVAYWPTVYRTGVLCIQVHQKHLQFQVTIPSAMADATFLPLNSIVFKVLKGLAK